MYTVLSVLQVFIAVVLIFLILLHSGKDAGMSGAFGVGAAGGSSGGSLMERNLDRWTILFAIAVRGEHDRAPEDLAPQCAPSWSRATAGPTCSSCATSPSPSRAPASSSSRSRPRASTSATSTSARAAAPYANDPPLIAGAEGAGTVVAVGEGVEDSRSATASRGPPRRAATPSAWPSTRRTPCRFPTGVSSEVGGRRLLQGMTAHYLCVSTYPVQEGDDVLVHAAAGGVGLLLTQMVKQRGGRVIATTSTDEKAELARGAGADEAIGYDGFAERVRELTGGKGVESSTTASPRTRSTAAWPRCAGAARSCSTARRAGRCRPTTSRTCARARSTSPAPACPTTPPRARSCCGAPGEVFGWIAEGKLDVRIGGRYALEDARRAHEDLEARRSTGKLVLVP